MTQSYLRIEDVLRQLAALPIKLQPEIAYYVACEVGLKWYFSVFPEYACALVNALFEPSRELSERGNRFRKKRYIRAARAFYDSLSDASDDTHTVMALLPRAFCDALFWRQEIAVRGLLECCHAATCRDDGSLDQAAVLAGPGPYTREEFNRWLDRIHNSEPVQEVLRAMTGSLSEVPTDSTKRYWRVKAFRVLEGLRAKCTCSSQ